MTSASQLPADFNLFIATPRAIHVYTQLAQKPLFECATDGIVNARAATDNSSLLAVADSHLVILHDAARGTDREYRLKSQEVNSLEARWRGSGRTDCLLAGRTASAALFARLAHTVLFHDAEYGDSGILYPDWRASPAAASSPVAAECACYLSGWKRVALGFAFSAYDVHTRLEIWRRRRVELSAGRCAIACRVCGVPG